MADPAQPIPFEGMDVGQRTAARSKRELDIQGCTCLRHTYHRAQAVHLRLQAQAVHNHFFSTCGAKQI